MKNKIEDKIKELESKCFICNKRLRLVCGSLWIQTTGCHNTIIIKNGEKEKA